MFSSVVVANSSASELRYASRLIFAYFVGHCNALCSADRTSHSESSTVVSGAVGYSSYAFSFFIMLSCMAVYHRSTVLSMVLISQPQEMHIFPIEKIVNHF